jgi:helix-turn-helix protein
MESSEAAQLPRYVRVWRLAQRWGLRLKRPAADPLAMVRVPRYLGVCDLARRWDMTVPAVWYRLHQHGLPPFLIVGKRYYFPEGELEQWEQAQLHAEKFDNH